MGNYISNNSTWLHAKRILMRYNIENRTMKELDRQANKPKVAPKHDAGLINYHESLSKNEEYRSKANNLNKELDGRLKGVFVTSTGVTESIKSTKPLPLNRYSDTFPLGFKQSEKIPLGHLSLTQAMQFMSDRQNYPDQWPIERIADDYKIKPQLASDIIKYYQIFNVHCSDETRQKMIAEAQEDIQTISGQKRIE